MMGEYIEKSFQKVMKKRKKEQEKRKQWKKNVNFSHTNYKY